MTQYGTWVSYGGDARIWLAIGLLAVAGGVAFAGIRLPLPIRPTGPDKGPDRHDPGLGRLDSRRSWSAQPSTSGNTFASMT